MQLFSEGFELVIPAGESDDVFDHAAGAYRPEFVDAIFNDLRSEGIETSGADLRVQSWGYGADALSLAIIFGGLSAVFLAGKKVEENLDAWIRLGRRLGKAIARLRQRSVAALVSEPAAAAVAIATAAQGGSNEPAISLLSSVVVPVSNRSLNPDLLHVFLQHPHRYYVFVLKVDDTTARVVCLGSDGRTLFTHPLPLDLLGFLGRGADDSSSV